MSERKWGRMTAGGWATTYHPRAGETLFVYAHEQGVTEGRKKSYRVIVRDWRRPLRASTVRTVDIEGWKNVKKAVDRWERQGK